MARPDFQFLTKDVEIQNQLAREALEEAKRLDALLKNATTEEQKALLQEMKEKLLHISDSLVSNATSTATSASKTLLSLRQKVG